MWDNVKTVSFPESPASQHTFKGWHWKTSCVANAGAIGAGVTWEEYMHSIDGVSRLDISQLSKGWILGHNFSLAARKKENLVANKTLIKVHTPEKKNLQNWQPTPLPNAGTGGLTFGSGGLMLGCTSVHAGWTEMSLQIHNLSVKVWIKRNLFKLQHGWGLRPQLTILATNHPLPYGINLIHVVTRERKTSSEHRTQKFQKRHWMPSTKSHSRVQGKLLSCRGLILNITTVLIQRTYTITLERGLLPWSLSWP